MSGGKTEASCSPFAAQAEGFARRLDQLFTRVGKSADDHAWVWLTAFTVVYLACTVARSLAKPLWFDELMTFYISRVPGWKERLALGGVDGCPPLFYDLTHASLRLFGENSLASRMPEIIGFWLMCICLFLFARRRCTAIYALLAVLLSVGSMAYDYAYEARPYGLMLGMAGLSLWCWQAIAEGRRRTLALVSLTLSIAIAANIHYYGAQIAVPLLAGEACRTLERRKIDWGVLSAIALGLSPLIYVLPLTQRMGATANFVRSSPTFWSKPHSWTPFFFYFALLYQLVPPLFVAVAATAAVYFLRGSKVRREEPREQRFTLPEMIVAFGYLSIPAVMDVATWLKLGCWINHYTLPALLGYAILLVYLSNVFAKDRSAVSCLMLAALLGNCFYIALLYRLAPPVFAAVAATAAAYFLRRSKVRREWSCEQRFTLPEMFVAFGYLSIPAVMVLATWLKTGYWMDRYALTAVLGCVILFVYLSNVSAKDRSAISCLMLAALLGNWVLGTVPLVGTEPGLRSGVRVDSPIYRQSDHLPIVIADSVLFLQMAHYDPPEVVSRLVYLTDVAYAVRRRDFLPELSLAADRNILPGKIEDYAPFLSHHREFWLFTDGAPYLEWLPSRLRKEGWKLEYQGKDYDRVLFLVRR